MKRVLTIASFLTLTNGSFAQGTIDLSSYLSGSNGNGYSITIYSENYSNPGEGQISGNSTFYDLPAGNTVYAHETPLGGTSSGVGAGVSGEYNGNNYTIGFYFATSANALQTAVNTGAPGYSTLMDTTFGAGLSGTYDPADTGILYNIPNDPAGTPTYVAIAAWYSAGGAGSYAAAVAANVPHGTVSAINTVTPENAPYPPPNLTGLGLTSFDLVVNAPQPSVVPEPSVIELGISAACGVLFYRRRRTK